MKMPPPPDEPSRYDSALGALFATARRPPPDTSRAEFGFETRLLARLAAERSRQAEWGDFAAWCWRLLPGLAALTLAFVLWTARTPAGTGDDLAYAAAVQPAPLDDGDFLSWMDIRWLTPI